MTVTVGAGHTVSRARRARSPSTARSVRSTRPIPKRRSAACSRAASRACGGCGTARCAITCSKYASITGDGRLVKGGGPDGQERHRLRPAATVRRVARHARRDRAGDAAVPSASEGRAVVRRRPATPTSSRPAAHLWDGSTELVLLEGRRADVDAQARRPRLPRRRRRSRRARTAAVSRSRPDSVDARHERVGRRAMVRRARRRNGSRRVRRPRHVRATHGRPRTRTAAGCCAERGRRNATTTASASSFPARDLQRRIKDAFDPDTKLNPSRMPR